MDLESIYALMERFERSTLTGLELEQNGTRLKLDRTVTAAPAAITPIPSAAPAPSDAPAVHQPKESEAEYIKAPLVGTFYAASGPDSAPFVQVGDQIKKGQTVCILEAMKMMSEIPAPMDCVIEEVMMDNGSLAGFDAPLFRVRRL
ncbi:MAG: acetyl-CoA carboxylase biotin carboxyl carrier protein [Oscillospiraceae bacterium]|jgi:acetyl-CoA carboxylase biotin carboxyl carrier protein|nr:acetyl-CoA carboxylase biotin carboxyl carrier protein [Oscillospiraceae bacterium]